MPDLDPSTNNLFALYHLSDRNEHAHQVTYIDWCRRVAPLSGAVTALAAQTFAIPNAGAGAQKGQAGKMRSEGVTPGVPDLFLPVASDNGLGGKEDAYHGLFIEMKAPHKRARTSKPQREWLQRAARHGYCCRVAYGAGDAIEMTIAYLHGTLAANPIDARFPGDYEPVDPCKDWWDYEGSGK